MGTVINSLHRLLTESRVALRRLRLSQQFSHVLASTLALRKPSWPNVDLVQMMSLLKPSNIAPIGFNCLVWCTLNARANSIEV